jgi:2-methylcitrate dehydratase PrpD
MTQTDPLEGNDDVAVPIARYVAGLTYDDIDEANREAVKRLTLDCLGAAVAAAFEPGVVELRELVTEWGGREDATLIQSGVRVPAHHAVAVNSTASRALEIDDVHETAVIHTSATIVPVALAMAERSSEPVSGKELIAAVAAGIEIANRISLASRVSSDESFRVRRWSSTNLVATLAGALTAAKVARADAATTLHAFGYGYSNAAATKQGLADQALSVRVQHGVCSANGVVAAELALKGLTAPIHPLEGTYGFYRSFWDGEYDRNVILDGLGERMTITDVSIKPYPCCKFTHTAVAAAIAAGRDPRFDVKKVRRVVVTLDSEEYFSVVCTPLDVKQHPSTTVQAQFSMPYCAAVGMTRGNVGFADLLPPFVGTSEVMRLASITDCVLSENAAELRGVFPSAARIDVQLADGTEIATRATSAPGHPESPFNWDDQIEKFRVCCAYPSTPPPAGQIDELADLTRNLEDVEDVREFARLLAW